MIAYLNLRHGSGKLHDAFTDGLRACGYEVKETLSLEPGPRDILVTWNLPPEVRRITQRYSRVLVAENASWGNDFCGEKWRTLAINKHNTAGCFPVGGPERWDSLGVVLAPWRTSGETVLLAQRGIGPTSIAMPPRWITDAAKRHKARIRLHPGKDVAVPLETDLSKAGKVVTWGSGAAVKALMMGIHVVSEYPEWIAKQDNTDEGRLAMFRRIAWAQWRLTEIETGEAIRRLL